MSCSSYKELKPTVRVDDFHLTTEDRHMSKFPGAAGVLSSNINVDGQNLKYDAPISKKGNIGNGFLSD